jgi:hypothetical protein
VALLGGLVSVQSGQLGRVGARDAGGAAAFNPVAVV